MKSAQKAVTTMWLLISIIWPGPAGWAMEADEIPETINIEYLQELYEAVTFDHSMHAGAFACSACHHHTTGDGTENPSCKRCHAESKALPDVSCSGCHVVKRPETPAVVTPTAAAVYHIDKPGLRGALHLQCLGCHRAEGGPVACQDCHTLTAAGRKRMAVKK
ncbi:MAG: cytochrome c3 family protein [Desulfoprunum sp.]|nr:cytochrome c3 family protein [Desulfoprunum sp.]